MYQPARIGTFMNRAKNLRITRLARVIATGIAAVLFFFLIGISFAVRSFGFIIPHFQPLFLPFWMIDQILFGYFFLAHKVSIVAAPR